MASLKRLAGDKLLTEDRPERDPRPGPMISDDFGQIDDMQAEAPAESAGGRAGTAPRENPDLGGGVSLRPPGGGQATPSRPMSPTPMAGSMGPMPFPPMGTPSPASLTRPRSGNLYGSAGGLQGGGLGLPLDPTSNQQSDPISTLLQLLTRR